MGPTGCSETDGRRHGWVMVGVKASTLECFRRSLDHSQISMTQQYAHVTGKVTCEAVTRIGHALSGS